MPFTCHIDLSQHLGMVTLSGTVTGPQFAQIMEALYQHPDWTPGLSALWDARGIRELVFEPRDMEHVVDKMQHLEPLMGNGRAAFVVPREIDYIIARLLIYRGSGSARERRTFLKMGEAVAWLNEVGAATGMRAAG